MPRHFETKILPYTPKQMYDLVSDIKRYPDFLPWCLDATVSEHKNGKIKADLVVGSAHFREQFTSIVTLSESSSISVEYGGGALRHLTNEWTFKPVDGGRSSEVYFLVDFALRSRLLGAMMELFFHKAFQKMMRSFEDRAAELYKESVDSKDE